MPNATSQFFRNLLGSSSVELSQETLTQLIGLSESEELEVKSAMYSESQSDKKELALDVAAIANSGGGLLLLGISESNDRIVELSPLPRDPSDLQRLRDVINHRIRPHIQYEIKTIDISEDEWVIAILISEGVSSPYIVSDQDTLRVPVRRGTSRVYLNEAEIANRYRERFRLDDEIRTLISTRQDKLTEASQDLEGAALIVSIVPQSSGRLDMSRQSINEYSKEIVEFCRTLPPACRTPQLIGACSVGLRRVICADYRFAENQKVSSFYFEGHQDGGFSALLPIGVFGIPRNTRLPQIEIVQLDVEQFTWSMIELLCLAGFHLRQAGGGGDLHLAMRVVSPRIGDSRAQMQFMAPRTSFDGLLGDFYPGGRPIKGIDEVLSTLSLNDIEVVSQRLTGSAYLLVCDLLNAFGIHAPQILSSDGSLVSAQLTDHYRTPTEAWCARNGISIVS